MVTGGGVLTAVSVFFAEVSVCATAVEKSIIITVNEKKIFLNIVLVLISNKKGAALIDLYKKLINSVVPFFYFRCVFCHKLSFLFG